MVGGWPAGATVEVELRSADGAALVSESLTADEAGFAISMLGSGVLAAGQTLSATDGTTTKELMVVDLTLSVDRNSDTISGTAPPGATVQINVNCAQTGCELSLSRTADSDGAFSLAVGGLTDIVTGSQVFINVPDQDNDWVQYQLEVTDQGTFTESASPPARGVGLVVFGGGSLAELIAAAMETSAVSITATSGGSFVTYVLGAPAFANVSFSALFAAGVPATTPFILLVD